MTSTGTLYTVSAPSGAGKTSLVNALIQQSQDLRVSVSHTTRPCARERQTASTTISSTSAVSRHAGTGRIPGARAGIWQSLRHLPDMGGAATAAGTDVILEIDWQGAQQVKRLLPETRAIFIMPPSREALQQRLNSRGQDDDSHYRGPHERGGGGDVALCRGRLPGG